MTHVHFIGIGGSGLSAIARLLLESGYTVTGSDRILSPFAVDLQAAGISVQIGHEAENIRGADWIVRSSAIPDDNPEVVAACLAGIPVFKRSDFLGQLMADKIGIAIAGTHGKTTTTAMLAWTLSELGQDPSFIVGGVLTNLGVNARAGKGKFFVIEADEYDRMFLGLKPKIEVVTNVEYDHPDCYPTPSDFQRAFQDFIHLLPADGKLVAYADDTGTASVLKEITLRGTNIVRYGIQAPKLDSKAENIHPNPMGGFSFDAYVYDERANVALSVPGKHNVLNALAVLCVINLLGLPLKDAAFPLSTFTGVGRRFQVCGEANEITIIDDYAHHPTEIRATVAAARDRYNQRHIWAVWQPHTYSRTQSLFNEFTRSFNDADHVIVTEIYAAREEKQDYSSVQIVKSMNHPNVRFIPTLNDVVDYLVAHLQPGDVLLVLSAGDADQVSTQVLTRLQESEAKDD